MRRPPRSTLFPYTTPFRSLLLLDDELARRLGEVARAVRGDDEHVLETHAADGRVVDAGLDRHDVTGYERLRARARDRRRLVDLEADAVPCAVNEAAGRLIRGIALLAGTLRVIAGAPDDVLDELVHLASGHAGTERADALVLSMHHDLVHLADFLGGFPLADRARHIRPIPGRLVLREDVHDDRLAGVPRTGPDLVRIRGLRSRGADCAFRGAAALEGRGPYHRPQSFGR